MEGEHHVIVLGSPATGSSAPLERPRGSEGVSRHEWQKSLHDLLERLADVPDTRGAMRVDVREESQDAPPGHGPRGEGVDVESRVILLRRGRSPRDLEWSIAGQADDAASPVPRQQSVDERARLLDEALQHPPELLALRSPEGTTAHPSGGGVEGHVLGPAVRRVPAEKRALSRHDLEREIAQDDNVAPLEM